MNRQINLAVQVLPRAKEIHPYDLVDKAIDVIKKSGVKYLVCPFETVMEGNYDELMKIIEEIHNVCYEAGAEEIICNIKIQSHNITKVEIDDKMKKYRL
jgi:uncharacterized protein (TIGR00106 family)